MPKLSKEEIATAKESLELEEWDRWFSFYDEPPSCPSCIAEEGYYCEKHMKLAEELKDEERWWNLISRGFLIFKHY